MPQQNTDTRSDAQAKPGPWDLIERWRGDGTFERVEAARVARTPIKIKRSSGKLQDAIIASCAGHGGLSCVVVWADDLDAIELRIDVGGDRVHWNDCAMGKGVRTRDLVELNPWLAKAGPS